MFRRSSRGPGASCAVPSIFIALAGSSAALGAGPFAASIDLSAVINGADGFVLNGVSPGDYSGRDVSSAGDINGDGFDDLIIGAYVADPSGQTDAGESYVVFGGTSVGAGGSLNLSALNGTNGFVLIGIDAGDYSGRSVSSAGDVNGDGVGDLIIGAPYASPNGQAYAGESYVVFGGPSVGAGGSLDLSALNGTNGFVLNGIDSSDYSGRFVSSAGDVNGDGVGDLILGAWRADPNGQSSAGESYVVFGGPSVGAGGSLELSSLNGTNGFVLNGIDSGDYSGRCVSSAGDVNGDGIDDLIIGAQGANPNGQSNAGESSIVFGKSTGFAAALNLSTLNGTNGFVVNGIDADNSSGTSASSAGDVNGDGIDDLIIGADFAAPGGRTRAGQSYVVFGGPSVGAGGSLDLSALNGTNGFALNGIGSADFSGRSVSSAGDVNGDGIDDVIIGADSAGGPGQSRAGETYVVFGGPNVSACASLELSSLNGTSGFVLNGIDMNDSSGTSVSSAGDVNGDGIDDVIIGAPFAASNGQTYAGESYVVFGRASRGACCLTGALCIEGLEASCTDFGGTFFGFSSECTTTICPGCRGDLTGDGAVNSADFNILAGNFGCTSTP